MLFGSPVAGAGGYLDNLGFLLQKIPIIIHFLFFKCSEKCINSEVFPLLLKRKTKSDSLTTPRSPCKLLIGSI